MKVKQSILKHLRYTLDQFKAEFPNDDICLEAIKEQRYPGGVVHCAECGKERKLYRVKGRPAYACEVGHHFYPLAGTIFEKSTTALHIWFYAMYQMGSTRCGISAKQIERETGVTYKTAWRMFKQLLSRLDDEEAAPLGGKSGPGVEMDEAYFGGRRKGTVGRPLAGDHKDKKTTAVGMVERKGRVRAVVAADVKGSTLLGLVKEHVLPKSTVFTDDFASYDSLDRHLNEYNHRRINHSEKIYVMGDVHTNTIEGFWSLVKTGIRGVYNSVGL